MAMNLLKHASIFNVYIYIEIEISIYIYLFASAVWGFRSESFGQLNLLKLLPWYSTRKRNLKNSFKKKKLENNGKLGKLGNFNGNLDFSTI